MELCSRYNVAVRGLRCVFKGFLGDAAQPHCCDRRAFLLAFIFSRRFTRWLLVISISSILSRAVRNCMGKNRNILHNTVVVGRINKFLWNFWSGGFLMKMWLVAVMVCCFKVLQSKAFTSVFTCNFTSTFRLHCLYLSLKFPLFCFEFIFYLLWVVCRCFVSRDLTFKSVNLENSSENCCHANMQRTPDFIIYLRTFDLHFVPLYLFPVLPSTAWIYIR